MVDIGGYRLVRRLGAGGMGTVHEALDADGRNVAIKVLHPHISADPAARSRLQREVALLHRVRHPGVARVLDAEVDGVEAFIVTELISGVPLEDHVRERGPLSVTELRDLARGLYDGLTAIHRAGIVHRDLKPGNVMLSPDGPVIIDFGIAQVADDVRLTQTGMVTGTAGYLAPEVLAGANPEPGGDWWAWAAVLVFAVTGHPPFGRGPIQAILGRVSTGEADTAGLSPAWARLFTAALHPDISRRPPPHEVLAALEGRANIDDVLPLAPAPPVVPLPASAPTAIPTPTPSPVSLPPTIYPPSPTAEAPQHPRWPVANAPQYPGWPAAEPPMPPWAEPLPRYRLTTASLGVALAGVAAVAPGPWLAAMTAMTVVLGAVGYGWRQLRATRMRRGARRSDRARVALAAPWYTLVAAALTVPGLLLAIALGIAGLWLLRETPADIHGPTWWALAVAAASCWWLLPSSRAAHHGARCGLRAIRRPGRIAVTLTALAVIALFTALVTAQQVAEPQWWPLPPPPWWGT